MPKRPTTPPPENVFPTSTSGEPSAMPPAPRSALTIRIVAPAPGTDTTKSKQ